MYSTINNDAGGFEPIVCDDSWLNPDDLDYNDESGDPVYFTNVIHPNVLSELLDLFHQTFVNANNTAIKLSTGEKGGTYYLNPNLIKDTVRRVNGTIVECNTAYKGKRQNTEDHMRVAQEHGFTSIAPVIIMDNKGDTELKCMTGYHYLKEDLVGKKLLDYDSMLVLSHGKGHAMAGMGGALKNISIGIASSKGKSLIHTGGKSKNITVGFDTDTPVDIFQESMADACSAIIKYFNEKQDGRIVYITVLNNISIDCDCDSHPHVPEIKDVGVIASKNPVALDQCMYDIFQIVPGGNSLRERMRDRHAVHILEAMEDFDFSRNYKFTKL